MLTLEELLERSTRANNYEFYNAVLAHHPNGDCWVVFRKHSPEITNDMAEYEWCERRLDPNWGYCHLWVRPDKSVDVIFSFYHVADALAFDIRWT